MLRDVPAANASSVSRCCATANATLLPSPSEAGRGESEATSASASNATGAISLAVEGVGAAAAAAAARWGGDGRGRDAPAVGLLAAAPRIRSDDAAEEETDERVVGDEWVPHGYADGARGVARPCVGRRAVALLLGSCVVLTKGAVGTDDRAEE